MPTATPPTGVASPTTARDARWHLHAEMARVLGRLAALLRAQRARGRTAVGDAVGGLVIEDGEAEGLVVELAAALEEPAAPRPPSHWAAGGRAMLHEQALAASRQGARMPLLVAAQAFDLSDAEYDALVLAAAVELDPRVGRLVAYLNDHVGRPRPTLGLVQALASVEDHAHAEHRSLVGLLRRPAVRDGLFVVEGAGPTPALELRVDAGVAARIADDAAPDESLRPARGGLLDEIVLPDAVRDVLRTWGEELRQSHPVPMLFVVGRPETGRHTAAHAAASVAARPIVCLELPPASSDDGSRALLRERARAARREARWHRAVIVARAGADHDDGAAYWGALWEALDGAPGPIAIVLEPEQLAAASARAPSEPLVVAIPEPDVGARALLWRALLPEGASVDDAAVDALAARFQFGAGRIARVVRRADASLAGRAPGTRRLDAATLESTARAMGAAVMGPLAERLSLPFSRSQLVVPDRIDEELDLALAWVRYQRQVLDEWRLGERLGTGRGLTVLFSGPPGTGKTMAAQVLARELGLELFRVDLSRTVSKYIGETEKNLGRIFDEARASGAALLFDEADALFGRRSEVKDAHDRYANVEIGYLLQRLELHDGVTVLASNRSHDLDEAFVRRFHVIVDFPLPSEADRLRIWRGMLPPEVARDPDVDLAHLARLVELSGGEIKNALLAASYLAAADGGPVAMRHLRRAVWRELLKNGRVVDERLHAELAP